ncbi:MAG: hypothetical protein KJ587_02835 [Alphaproteobacteria bacterium]|nr:hypothetical protein [Alphaproteobacteria bacterium]
MTSMHLLNRRRALWARLALEAFAEETGAEMISQALADLIADLGHLCDADGLDFLALASKAIGTWKIEQIEPDGISHPPEVSIAFTH